jgi:hypothetical protein
MLEVINIYLLIGAIWLLIHELGKMELDNGQRIRLFILWPITLFAFIIGMIQVLIDRNSRE